MSDSTEAAVLSLLTSIHNEVKELREEMESRKFRGHRRAIDTQSATERTPGRVRGEDRRLRAFMAGDW